MTSLRIKYKDIQALHNWLLQVKLAGKQSRVRTRFLREITPVVKEIDQERIKLAAKYADKDEEGKPKVEKTKEGHEKYAITPENQVEFYRELNDVLNEEYIIDLVDSKKELLKQIREILLNTEYEFAGKEAEWYDDICLTLEGAQL